MVRSGTLHPQESKIVVVQQLGDAATVVIAHYLTVVLHGSEWTPMHTLATAVAAFAFMFGGELTGLYRAWRVAPLKHEVAAVWKAWALVVTVLLFVAFASKTSETYSRIASVGWFLLAPTMISVLRAAGRLALQELRRRGRNSRSVAIVGATEVGCRVAAHIVEEPWLGLRLVGFYDDRGPNRRIAVPRVVGEVRGDLDEVVERARRGEIDIVYVALPLRAEGRIRRLIRELSDTTASVYLLTDFYAYDLLQAEWTQMGDVPIVTVVETPFQGVDYWLKRAEDVVIGLGILAIIALPMLAIAAAIKLTSRGPVFFKQRRYGLNGEKITVLKFRTMTVCEDGAVVKQATKDDPRITRLGAILRRTSLDELPQFLQVITGHMSIVGPRPHAIAHNEAYRRQIPRYMLRHKVKPGITGWAQVNGWRGETDTLEKMSRRIEHDLAYIQNWSLFLDLKIIFLTIFGSAVRRNAY